MENLSTVESFQVVEQIVLALEKTSKILIFFTRETNKKPILSSSNKVGKNVY